MFSFTDLQRGSCPENKVSSSPSQETTTLLKQAVISLCLTVQKQRVSDLQGRRQDKVICKASLGSSFPKVKYIYFSNRRGREWVVFHPRAMKFRQSTNLER